MVSEAGKHPHPLASVRRICTARTPALPVTKRSKEIKRTNQTFWMTFRPARLELDGPLGSLETWFWSLNGWAFERTILWLMYLALFNCLSNIILPAWWWSSRELSPQEMIATDVRYLTGPLALLHTNARSWSQRSYSEKGRYLVLGETLALEWTAWQENHSVHFHCRSRDTTSKLVYLLALSMVETEASSLWFASTHGQLRSRLRDFIMLVTLLVRKLPNI